MLVAIPIAIFAIGAAIGIYAFLAPRRRASARVRAPEREPLLAQTTWTNAAGAEFDGLSESARCDLIFAVAALDDTRSAEMLGHALADPSEAVALAAAHALASRGRAADVADFLEAHPGDRADRIARTLALLDPQARGPD